MPALAPTRLADFSEVPVIDVTHVRDVRSPKRAEIAREITEACERVGFFYIENHGVDRVLMNRMFELSKAFFPLPMEARMRVRTQLSANYRGYLPMFLTGNDTEIRGNRQEAFHVGLELDSTDPDVIAGQPLRGPNQWPEEMPELKEAMQTYYKSVHELSLRLLEIFAIGLELPEDYFSRHFQKPLSMLRLLHYPEQEVPSDIREIGTRPHCDAGALTILMQDNTGGLEVENKSGDWVVVPPIEGAYVINIGNIMKMWTNGLFSSTPHRVINRYGRDRYSIPYFANPSYDVQIEPLPATVTAERPAQFAPLSAGEHLLSTYQRIWPAPEIAT